MVGLGAAVSRFKPDASCCRDNLARPGSELPTNRDSHSVVVAQRVNLAARRAKPEMLRRLSVYSTVILLIAFGKAMQPPLSMLEGGEAAGVCALGDHRTRPFHLADHGAFCVERGKGLFSRVDLIEHAAIPNAEYEILSRCLLPNFCHAFSGLGKPGYCLQPLAVPGRARPDVKSRILYIRGPSPSGDPRNWKSMARFNWANGSSETRYSAKPHSKQTGIFPSI